MQSKKIFPCLALRIFILLLPLLTLACGTLKETEDPTLYETITTSRQSYIYEKPGLRTQRLETLKEGELIKVLLEPKNSWLKVRTPSGKTGWIESRDALRQSYYDEWMSLKTETAKLTPQMSGETADEVYLRLRPGRDSIKVYKMIGSKKIDIYSVAYIEKVDPAAAAEAEKKKLKPVAPPPAEPKDAKGKKKKKRAANTKQIDIWYLVRTPEGTVGWLYGSLVTLNVPEELARYAETKIIVAWRKLSVYKDSDGTEHPWYLSIDREPNSDEDFDRVRVLYWNPKHNRYELGFRVQNITGIFPIESTQVDPGQPGNPSFKIRHINDDNPNEIIVDEYEMIGSQGKKIKSTTEKIN